MCGSSDLDNFYIDDIKDEAELDKILHIEVGHSDAGDGRSLTAQQELETKQEADGASDDTLHDEPTKLEVQPFGEETSQYLPARCARYNN